ncbi:hypothetical protein, partial [Azospirillum argentinense]|uniref:hypothetical protein n=1 Tax=Azospirillum argentinense TaxID=2970906 RepID=UPI00190EBD0E
AVGAQDLQLVSGTRRALAQFHRGGRPGGPVTLLLVGAVGAQDLQLVSGTRRALAQFHRGGRPGGPVTLLLVGAVGAQGSGSSDKDESYQPPLLCIVNVNVANWLALCGVQPVYKELVHLRI